MIDGNKAWQLGKFELLRIWGVLWPVIVGGLVTYLTTRSTELGEAGQATLALIATVAAKALQQWSANNSGKQL